MPSVVYGTSRIGYSINRSRQRTTAEVAVDPKKGVVVTCPQDTSADQIEKIVLKKAPWILRKMKRLEEVAAEPPEREYVSGEAYYYLGRGYRLKVIEDETVYPYEAKLKAGRFLVRIPQNSDMHPREVMVSSALKSWFLGKAENRLRKRVDLYSPKVGVEPKGIIVKNQMKRWGTCTKDKVLYLNFRIIMAPMSVIDYVVVHELTHMNVNDHSIEFWNNIRAVLPDYERRKDWLRINGPSLII
ncbi:MAG: M48 family metallopeptidase [Candidatus Thorarchaeota archaeon]